MSRVFYLHTSYTRFLDADATRICRREGVDVDWWKIYISSETHGAAIPERRLHFFRHGSCAEIFQFLSNFYSFGREYS